MIKTNNFSNYTNFGCALKLIREIRVIRGLK